MILTLVPPVLLLLGIALGGRPAKLLDLPIRFGWLALVSWAIEWLLMRVSNAAPPPVVGATLLGAHGLLAVCLLLNRRLPGVKIALVGSALNLAVMAANGGLMPVTPTALAAAHIDSPAFVVGERLPHSKDVLLTDSQVVLGGLGDSFALSWPVPLVFSLGDLAVAAGLGALILVGMCPDFGRRRRRLTVRAAHARAPDMAGPTMRPAT